MQNDTSTQPQPARRRSQRNGLIGKIHAMKKELALEEDSYRDRLAKATGGKRSCSQMSMSELEAVKRDFMNLGAGRKSKAKAKRAGGRRMAVGGQASKIRALWLSLYNLAELDDPSEAALAAFVRKTTGIEALDWLGLADGDQVIKALRGWCRRIGFQEPMARRVREIDAARVAAGVPKGGHGFAAKVVLIELQWQRLQEGGFTAKDHADLGFAVHQPEMIDLAVADKVIERLGAGLRRRKAEGGDG